MDCLCRTCDQFIYDENSINNPNLNDIDKIIIMSPVIIRNSIYITSNVISI